MTLQAFYDLADLMKAEIVARNQMMGNNKTDYDMFIEACTEVGKLLVDGSQVATYSDGSFNTAVDTATTNLGYDPTNLSERENGLMVIVSALGLPTGVTASQLVALITEGWANMFTKDGQGNYNSVEAIASTVLAVSPGTESITSSGIMIPNDIEDVQVTVNKTAGTGTAKVEYAVSADDVSYSLYSELGRITNNEAKLYAINNIMIPKYLKVKITYVSGTVTVSCFVSIVR